MYKNNKILNTGKTPFYNKTDKIYPAQVSGERYCSIIILPMNGAHTATAPQ